MKSNCINVEHLIHILRYDNTGNEDKSLNSTHKRSRSGGNTLSADKLNGDGCKGEKKFDDIVSRYTLQSIGTCQDPKFLFLLLKNFARGKHSAIIEETVSKIDHAFQEKNKIIKELHADNNTLLQENQVQKRNISQLQEELAESDEKDQLISEMREAMKEAMIEMESVKN